MDRVNKFFAFYNNFNPFILTNFSKPSQLLQVLGLEVSRPRTDIPGIMPSDRSVHRPWYKTRQDKTRQREVTDPGTTVPLSPHLQCRYTDKQYSLYSTKNSD